MKFSKRLIIIVLLVLLTAPGLTAKAVKEETRRSAPEQPVIFTVGTSEIVETLDPHYAVTPAEIRLAKALFPGLFHHDPESGHAEIDLAERWEVNEDSTVFIFHLKKTAWSDGIPITASTIVESWRRILAPDSEAPFSWYPAMVISGGMEYNRGIALAEDVQIRALDEYTLYVGLSRPVPFFPEMLTHHSFLVLPVHGLKRYGQDWEKTDHLVTKGALSLKHRLPDGQVILRRRDDSNQEKTNYPEELVLKPIEAETASEAYRSGAVDWIPHGVLKETNMFSTDLVKSPYLGLYFALFRSDTEPYDDPRVRTALANAVDRKKLVSAVMEGKPVPASGLVPEMEYYPGGKSVSCDLTAAKQLFSLAGFPEGKDFPEMTILYNNSSADIPHERIAHFLQETWENSLGITVHPLGRSNKAYLTMLDQGRFDIVLTGWYGDYLDPETLLGLFASGSVFNAGGYGNREYDNFLSEAAAVSVTDYADQLKRMRILKQAEEVLLEADQALIPLFYPVRENLIDLDKWGGWHPNLLDNHPLEAVFLKEE
jgi:oligopeptide transport system substrate-binding protein